MCNHYLFYHAKDSDYEMWMGLVKVSGNFVGIDCQFLAPDFVAADFAAADSAAADSAPFH